MASAADNVAANATRPNSKGKRLSDNAVSYLTALGGHFVCAAKVALTTDEKGEHDFHVTFLPELISVPQAAKALAVSPTTVRRLLKDGMLVEHRVGRATTVSWDSVWAMLKACPAPS